MSTFSPSQIGGLLHPEESQNTELTDVSAEQILARAELSIERGRLVIRPKGGLTAPSELLSKYEERLIREILAACGRSGFRFARLEKADHFDNGKYPGAKLAFVDLLTGEERVAFFSTPPQTYTRSHRNGKKAGDRLPPGHFTVAKGSALRKLWKSTGLDLKKPSEIHRMLGNLKPFVMECELHAVKDDRAVANTMRVLNITAAEVANCIDKSSTSRRQAVDKSSTRNVDKETQQSSVLDDASKDSNRRAPKAQNKEQVISKRAFALSDSEDLKDSPKEADDFEASFALGDPFADCPRDPSLKITYPDWHPVYRANTAH